MCFVALVRVICQKVIAKELNTRASALSFSMVVYNTRKQMNTKPSQKRRWRITRPLIAYAVKTMIWLKHYPIQKRVWPVMVAILSLHALDEFTHWHALLPRLGRVLAFYEAERELSLIATPDFRCGLCKLARLSRTNEKPKTTDISALLPRQRAKFWRKIIDV